MNIIETTILELQELIQNGLLESSSLDSDLKKLNTILLNCEQRTQLISLKGLSIQLENVSSIRKNEICEYIEQLKRNSNVVDNSQPINNQESKDIDNETVTEVMGADRPDPQMEELNLGNLNLTQQELLSIVFGLSNQIGQLQRFLTDVNEKNTFTYMKTLEMSGTIQRVFKDTEILINDAQQSETRILNAQSAIHEDVISITEKVTSVLFNKEIIRTARIHGQNLENLITETKKRVETDIDIIYEKTKRNADIVALEIVEQAHKKATTANKEYIAEVNANNQRIIELSSKKNTNIVLFGLITTFAINIFVAGFVAKLVANYTENSTTEYIHAIMSSNQQQDTQVTTNRPHKK